MKLSILLISCYELGHQPLSLAWPLAALRAAGLDASTVDLAVEEFPAEKAAKADLVAIAVPMHTALRIGVDAARQVRAVHPSAHLCFFGLYAWLNRVYLLQGTNGEGRTADSVVAGEAETVLVGLAQALAAGVTPEDCSRADDPTSGSGAQSGSAIPAIAGTIHATVSGQIRPLCSGRILQACRSGSRQNS